MGCGNKMIEGYTHIDALPFEHVDYKSDVRDLSFIPDNASELIYCSHVLEHFGRWEIPDVLQEWFRILAPGGTLRLAVPDFAACAKIYFEAGFKDGLTGLIGLICGGQKNEFDYHKSIFDEEHLTNLLYDAGFTRVGLWNWRETEHAHIDDYSQAYLPHMNKESGQLMSLNIQATK